ncbi:hypothetical protein BB559_007082 [Furculomyces boomerangus]|uniref:Uncharacterized protein n=2 Tax=Harpellales TaxID=61421 RepID=A0A2T9XZ54_9FUNG|nr:hypothetical protein BB559_007082 [Furculomyces boomerangus]PWA00250.1 hypothetical protein BB558_003699 [Smittium angustum]
MENSKVTDCDVVELHGFFAFPETDSIIEEEVGDEKYEIFQSKTKKKLVPLSEIEYKPKFETDEWFDKSGTIEFNEWMRERNGPAEIKYTVERHYFGKKYQSALDLSENYINYVGIKNGSKVKGLMIREILEIAALSAIKLSLKNKAIEYVILHKKAGNKDPGHYHFRGSVYQQCGLIVESINEYMIYLKERKLDPQIWSDMGINLQLLVNNTSDKQLFEKDKDINDKSYENKVFLYEYLLQILSLGCQLKSHSILIDCSTWGIAEYAQKRKAMQIENVDRKIEVCLERLKVSGSCGAAHKLMDREDLDVGGIVSMVELKSKPYIFDKQDLETIEQEINNTVKICIKTFKKTEYASINFNVLEWISKTLFLTRRKVPDEQQESSVSDL